MPPEGNDASFINDEVKAPQDGSDALWKAFHLWGKYRKNILSENFSFFTFKNGDVVMRLLNLLWMKGKERLILEWTDAWKSVTR